MVAGASQSSEWQFVAVGRWNSARLLLDSAKVESPITTTTSTAITTGSVSLEVAIGEQTGSTSDQFGSLRSKDGTTTAAVVEAAVLKAIKGIAVAAGAIKGRGASRSNWMDDTVGRLSNAHSLR